LIVRSVKGTFDEVLIPSEGRVLLLAIGKSSLPMIETMHDLIRSSNSEVAISGLVLGPPGPFHLPEDTVRAIGHHPLPEPWDVGNAEIVKGFISSAQKRDLIVFLLSGGASSMLFSPRGEIDPFKVISISRELMRSGSDISEMNSVRTYLSSVKGGRLRALSGTDNWVTISFSDVPGDDPRLIGSGPGHPWAPARDLVLTILERRNVDPSLIASVASLPERAPPQIRAEREYVIASGETAVRTAAEHLSDYGYEVRLSLERYSGEARNTAQRLLAEARSMNVTSPSAYVVGGETTVTVKGAGRGGRNLEMAIALAGHLHPDEIAICLATDGSDGNSGMAGAMMWAGHPGEGGTQKYLEENDSGSFFRVHPGGLHATEPGANLADVFILLRAQDLKPFQGPPLP